MYLINNKYKAANPVYAIPATSPFVLYFIINTIIAMMAIIAIVTATYVNSC